MKRFITTVLLLPLLVGMAAWAGGADPKPEKGVKAVKLPGDEVSFQRDGVEITRFTFAKNNKQILGRPMLFPVIGPSGNPLTLQHGRGAEDASHTSVWHSYGEVNGITYEGNHPNSSGRQIHKGLEKVTEGEASASVTSLIHWVDVAKESAALLLVERRRYTVQPLDKGEWLLVIDSQFEAVTDVTFGQSPNGLFCIKMTEAISLKGGGHNRTSNGDADFNGVLKKGAKWADYYGHPNPDAKESILKVGNNGRKEGDWYKQPNPNKTVVEGIAVFDHPKNPSFPTFWRARTHGRLATSGITSDGVPVKLAKGKTLRLRWGAYVHGDQTADAIEARWLAFSKTDLDDLTPPK